MSSENSYRTVVGFPNLRSKKVLRLLNTKSMDEDFGFVPETVGDLDKVS